MNLLPQTKAFLRLVLFLHTSAPKAVSLPQTRDTFMVTHSSPGWGARKLSLSILPQTRVSPTPGYSE